MTLPFRRRHHDDEAAHDRARSLMSNGMLEPLATDETAWLERHLGGCAECRRDRDAYTADREALRALRDRAPEPPRDLWARTAAALDREAVRGPRGAGARSGPAARRPRWGSAQLGAAAAALIVVVVIGTAIWPRDPLAPNATSFGSITANVTLPPEPDPTRLIVDADDVTFVRIAADGSLELVTSHVDEVCPRGDRECGPRLPESTSQPLNIGTNPSTVSISPDKHQLVVESPGDATEPGTIYIVPLSSDGPPPSIVPSVPPSAAPGSPDPSIPVPSPGQTPPGGILIASGVTVVGDIAYSDDQAWLAFSARPSDGSTGPDLYVWAVGSERAEKVTDDHGTYFSSWYGGRIVASSLPADPVVEPGASAEPAASDQPAATGEPVASDQPVASGEPGAETSPPPPLPIEAQPVSFLFDPATRTRTDFTATGVWLPVVDPNGRSVTYWAGSLVSTDDRKSWQLGTGQLVLDGWTSEVAAEPTEAPSGAIPGPTATAGTGSPEPSTAPVTIGPAGTPTPIAVGPTAAFKTMFDPEGARLAVWIQERLADPIGRLRLLVLDPATGALLPDQPLPSTPALSRFSLETGRLAWVSPSGQDGQESAVNVLGWNGDEFGAIQTRSAKDLLILN
jgi:hypothetical protein